MHFQQFLPPEPLRAQVRYFWTLDSRERGAKSLRTIADGCPGLILQQTGAGSLLDQAGKPWPELLLYGQSTQANTMQADGPFRLVGACLSPGAERVIFSLRADELTNTCVDVDLLGGASANFRQRLQSTDTVATQLEMLASFLLVGLRTTPTPLDAAVEQALHHMLRSQGPVSLPDLQAELPLSERSFQRKFKESVGVSPKLFARICQFQTSLGQLRTAAYDKLSDLAFANEYADQSHHIRAFKEFAGVSPYQYGKCTREVLENLTEVL